MLRPRRLLDGTENLEVISRAFYGSDGVLLEGRIGSG